MGSVENYKMTMDFYDDIDIDFGDKFAVGEAIRRLEGESKKKSSSSEKTSHKKSKVQVVFEDEVDPDEYEIFDYSRTDDDFIQTVDSIAQEVSEITGNAMLNEHLEQQYKETNPSPSTSKKPPKSRSKKTSHKPPPPPTKSELRKEMGHDVVGADEKVAFGRNRGSNALVKALEQRSPTVESQVAVKEVHAEAADDEVQVPERDYKMHRVRKWVENLMSSSEDDFYSANNSSSSSSYYSATPGSASEAETTRRYRATSKRLSVGKVSTSTPISDEKVNFASSSSSKKTPPPAKPTPKAAPPKIKKSPEIYVPGSYNLKYEYRPNDFPAIK
ncbi:serine/arginine repetitive matrix protein 1-like [Planococcus citri]|uniref:serine/arginine repetitive matrix protein 1-like n=1 Tax=Planococcus citri TaxID=170843 RepID=UPI0031F82A92